MADLPHHQSALPAEPTLPEPKDVPLPSSPLAGTKRSASSLLPAFEPFSSSPALPRPVKRQNTASCSAARLKYPTPVPTSSTGILSSSPPRPSRPAFVRTSSQRAPLASLPTAHLPDNGTTLTMGRSSNSSNFQLSSNRLISRVHVKARYVPPTDTLEPAKMEIICNGWNGLKLHCQGRTWELFKGDTFTAEMEGKDIMLDVLDARVMLAWPKKSTDAGSESSWEESPRRVAQGGSPMRRPHRIQSPVSPTPGQLNSSQRLQALFPSPKSGNEIQIFEDEPELPPQQSGAIDVGASMRTEATASFSSELSEEPDSDGENNPNEENDPVVHSFGPFGADLQASFAGISTRSPKTKGSPRKMPRSPYKGAPVTLGPSPKLRPSPQQLIPCEPLFKPQDPEKRPSSPAELPKEDTPSPVDPALINHVVNQLAFSRLSSTPLSTIMQNLPAPFKIGLTSASLRVAIESTQVIGTIERQGKDAAGKALESEYYYVPEFDDDEQRRAAVVDGLRKPSLRACRRQHKQYYWKRPKTP